VISHPTLPGCSLVCSEIDFYVDTDLHDLFPGNPEGFQLTRPESVCQPAGQGLQAGMKSPGQQMSAGENGRYSRREVLSKLQHDAIHLPHVDAAAIDQLLIQDFLSELHFSLPSVEEG
jgi:hypothetical protein